VDTKPQRPSNRKQFRCFLCGNRIDKFPFVRYKVLFYSHVFTRIVHCECWDDYPEISKRGIIELAHTTPVLVTEAEER